MQRRRFLLNTTQALFSVHALGPLFYSLSAQANSNNRLRRPKFILYNHANSIQLWKVQESSWSARDGFELRGALAPFAPHASDLLVIEQMYNTASAYLHGNASAALSCASRGNTKKLPGDGTAPKIVGGITIDQLIANQLHERESSTSTIPSLVMGNPIEINGGRGCVFGTICGVGDNQPVFPITDPLSAYKRLFSSPVEDGAVAARLRAQKSQLDHLLTEINAVNKTLPQAQREKLEFYLSSVRKLETDLSNKLNGSQSLDCSPPASPEEVNDDIIVNDPALWKTYMDLGIAALRCGITNQVTLLHSYGCLFWRYRFDGVTKNHHHDVCHEEERGPFMTKILSWHAEQLAYMYSELKASGDADDTVILWMSDGGGRHHNGNTSYPTVLLGKPGNVLNTGQYVKFDKDEMPLARLHLSLARSFGSPITSFGDGNDPGSRVIEEIMV